jgi:serine/threonine-protein kinase RsbW
LPLTGLEIEVDLEEGATIMGLLTEQVANQRLNTFWREVVLPDEAPTTERSTPEAITQRVNETIELSIESKLELVEMVELVARSVTANMGFDEDDSAWIELAVREAVVNAIKHGNQYVAHKRVDVQFRVERDAMAIYVRDRGEGFDPGRLLDPRAPENLLKPSGRGIFWIHTFMDEVQYSAHPEGGCVVGMKRYAGLVPVRDAT